jgi:hypothetical protein
VFPIKRELGLRSFDDEDDDERGRGERWKRSSAIVRAIGCERVERWIWDKDMIGGAYKYTFDVGRVLESAVRASAEPAWRAAARGGLARAKIHTRAVEVADQIDEDEKIGRLQRQAIAMRMAKIADNARRSKVCYDALAEVQAVRERRAPSTISLSTIKPANYSIEQLRSMGYSVRETYDGVAVYHRHGKGPATLKLTGAQDRAAAWDGARRLLGIEL